MKFRTVTFSNPLKDAKKAIAGAVEAFEGDLADLMQYMYSILAEHAGDIDPDDMNEMLQAHFADCGEAYQ